MKNLGKTSSTRLFVAIDGYSESLTVHVNLHASQPYDPNCLAQKWRDVESIDSA